MKAAVLFFGAVGAAAGPDAKASLISHSNLFSGKNADRITVRVDEQLPDLFGSAVDAEAQGTSATEVKKMYDPVAKVTRKGEKEKSGSNENASGAARGLREQLTFYFEYATPLNLVAAVMILWVHLLGLFAYYRTKVENQTDLNEAQLDRAITTSKMSTADFESGDMWKYGLMSCHEAPYLTCFSICCGSLRWSDTMRMTGSMSYYAAFWVWITLVLFSPFTLGLGNFVLVLICAHYRQFLRAKLGQPHGTLLSLCEDILTYCCCTICAIVQEAREIEDAYGDPDYGNQMLDMYPPDAPTGDEDGSASPTAQRV